MAQNIYTYVASFLAGGAAILKADAQSALVVSGGGNSATANIAASAVIKASAGRIVRVSVNTAGSAPGLIHNCATVGTAAAANLIATIPNTVGVYDIEFPCSVGITYILGTGQVIAVSYN